MIDLLKECAYGGCSAKVDPSTLQSLLAGLDLPSDDRLMVGLSSSDDAGVYRLDDTTALIFTTDFFPPMVSDPFTFGRIAAANALSDVYAMGGHATMALNLMHYPSARLPLDGLKEIVEGGLSAIREAGALLVGGHTIDDERVQYGLAVVGQVAPDRVVTNGSARPGDRLVLTKPLGVGTMIAAHRLGMAPDFSYECTIEMMCRLNAKAAEAMQACRVTAATDVTGFGLIGHGYEMALASDVELLIDVHRLPVIKGSLELLDDGCIPGAVFRNIKYAGASLVNSAPLPYMHLCADPQTSGGLLMAVAPEKCTELIDRLHDGGDPYAGVIGEVRPANIPCIRLFA